MFRTLDQADLRGKRVLVRVDLNVPVENGKVADATRIERVAPTIGEIADKGGKVILLSDRAGIDRIGALATATIELPPVHPFVAPIVYVAPVQLLAYHVAVIRGTDVDQPRNLAKSVTVE